MTKAALYKMVRAEFERHTGDLQEAAAVRALGVPVFFWDMQSYEALLRLWGAMRAVSLIAEVSP